MTADEELPGGGLGYALNRAAHVWRSELAQELADVQVTPPQFFVLAALLHARSTGHTLRQRDVAISAGADANTASQIVRGLERRGILARERDPDDSRALKLTLTVTGHDLAVVCAARARALNRAFFADVDVATLYRMLLGLLRGRGG